jgi:ribosomal protein S18 acetylase RimI-like enzyme
MPVALSRYDSEKSYKGQKSFDCGHKVINDFVVRSLKQQTKNNNSVGYVLTEDDTTFVGFYTITSTSIQREELVVASLASSPPLVPVTKLSMLGVSLAYKRRGYGSGLLRHAMEITAEVSVKIGTRGLYLDADDDAYDFYVKHSFIPLKLRQAPAPTPMFLHLSTIKQATGVPHTGIYPSSDA